MDASTALRFHFGEIALSIPFRCAQLALIGVTGFWLAWGAVQGLAGLFYAERTPPRLPDGQPIAGRTVILVPIYHEDPVATFARVAAIDASLAAAGEPDIHIAILSDTRDEVIARARTVHSYYDAAGVDIFEVIEPYLAQPPLSIGPLDARVQVDLNTDTFARDEFELPF